MPHHNQPPHHGGHFAPPPPPPHHGGFPPLPPPPPPAWNAAMYPMLNQEDHAHLLELFKHDRQLADITFRLSSTCPPEIAVLIKILLQSHAQMQADIARIYELLRSNGRAEAQ